MRKLVTMALGSPLLLPSQGPATPDSWLTWAQAAINRPRSYLTVRPQAVDWLPTIDLPLARDPVADVWAVSSLLFPDPGCWTENTGYRNEPNSGDITGRAADVGLFGPRDVGSGRFHAMVFDLSGWSTPRIQFLVEFSPEQEGDLKRLLSILATVGVGRKTADGFGAIRSWSWQDTNENPVWGPEGTVRRPVPASSLPPGVTEPRFVYSLNEARWQGVPVLCAGPPPETWHPVPWERPAPAQSASDSTDVVSATNTQ